MLSHFTQHVALYPFPTCVLGQKKGYSSLMNWHTVPLKLRYKANRVLTIQTLHVFRAPIDAWNTVLQYHTDTRISILRSLRPNASFRALLEKEAYMFP